MKNLNLISKLVFIPLLFLLLTTISNAATQTDDFQSGKNGWTNNGSTIINYGNPINSKVYRIDVQNSWIEKTYDFGPSLANQPVTIEFDMWAVGGWESSGNAVDYFYVTANGVKVVDEETIPGTNGSTNEVLKKFSLTSTTDSDGKFQLQFKQDVSYIQGERAHIDNIVITVNDPAPPNICTGTRGLTGNYYNDSPRDNSFVPPIVLSRVDSTINFAWGGGSPDTSITNDNFSTEWTGTIYIPEDADYTFSLAHDDVMILSIDGTEIYNSRVWTGGATNFRDASPVHLTAGTYPINIKFVEWGGDAYAKLAWRNNASITSQVIVPSINFCTPSNSADLALSKPTPPSPLTANINEDIHFQPHLENIGPDDALGDITLSITYSLDVTVSSVPAGYTCSVSSGALPANTANICTSTNSIPASSNYDFLFTVQATEPGDLTQSIEIASQTLDPDTSNNSLTSDVVTISIGQAAVDDSFTTESNVPMTGNMFANDSGSGYEITSIDNTGLEGTIFPLDTTTGDFTFTPNTDFVGSTSFTYTLNNGGGSATVTIIVTATNVEAVDNTYEIYPDAVLNDNLLINDHGIGIEITNIGQPAHGTITWNSNGAFTYTPDNGYRGSDSFTYTITDQFGNTDDATVNITIRTLFTSGNSAPFELVNPLYARNLIGDYQIAGNTVLCLTEKTSGYGGTCHGDTDYQDITSNMHVSKYIDIDNDGGTWNSSSSNIDLSNTAYDPNRGIVWAGLFWEGRISSSDTYPIRYFVEDGPNAVTGIEVGKDGNVGAIDVTTIGTQNIKLKIDNGSYTNVLSSIFHTAGQTYSSFADVTAVLQSASLSKDKHVFTVANLTTMEGREGSPGAFGGWALVVIYAESYEFGKPRNISIYNGFIDIGTNDTPIEISGFKLPTSGDVLAQLSAFSGEGEHLYGYRSGQTNSYDWMKISSDGSSYAYMPGLTQGTHVGNRDNSFNAQLDNISRNHINGEYNDLAINNVGVDIDTYDVSDLMTSYRDNDANISSVMIKTYSNHDYITMSMIAFSAELYVPELCYDYTLDIDGYVLSSVNNEIKTPFGGFGKPLTTTLYLKSLEGDIDLSNVNVNYSVANTSEITYNTCPNDITYISETGQYDYTPACQYTHDSSAHGFGMYIGKNKTESQGGIISAFEDRYIKFESDLHASDIDADFQFTANYTVDYGSGAVPLTKIFGPDDLCEPTSNGFLPELGFFNITDITNNYNEWNLYTQISNRPFNLRLYAYAFNAATKDYLNPINNDLNLSVEVEVIRADDFNRDANTACNNENSKMPDVSSKFLNFANDGNGKMVEFGYAANEIDFAYRSAAMRIWYLTDKDDNSVILDNHNCTRNTQNECIKLYTSQYVGDTQCQTKCRTIASTGNCYDCLRTNYGQKVCSRDNFAIRPEAFITQVYDSNQSNNINDQSNHIANSIVTASEFSLVSGYDYRFDINATNHSNDIATPRYIQHFEPGSDTHYIRMNWWPGSHTVSDCNDVEDKNISLNIFNGSNVNPITDLTYVDKVDQIGKYRFEVHDENWSSADWDSPQLLHHVAPPAGSAFPDYSAYYKDGPDCIQGSDWVASSSINSKQGCVISSVHTNNDTGEEYKYLYAQYYPYKFDVSTLLVGARPIIDGGNNAFVYINTPDKNVYPDGIDENMSYNIQGTFSAKGKDDGLLSNFVENCYADSVDMALHQNYRHTAPTQVAELSYDLINHDTANGTISRTRENGVVNHTADPAVPIIIAQGQNYFVKDMNGSLNMDLGYNYVRAINTPLNPRSIHMRDFNISYTTPPANVFADLETDHKIFGDIHMDQNVTFMYARAKPSKTLYDDITAANVDTPVSVVVYCDLGYTECQNRGVMALLGQTNQADWWRSVDHSQLNGDGNIELVSVPTSALNTTSVNIISNGIEETVNVNNGGVVPLTVPVNLVVDDLANIGPLNYTDRWLIYNPESAILPPVPFYRVNFIGNSGWVGYGDTGHVVGGTVNDKKNKRLEW